MALESDVVPFPRDEGEDVKGGLRLVCIGDMGVYQEE